MMTMYTISSMINPFVIYVGSTQSPITKRMWAHKSACINGKSNKLYNYMRENGGIENYYIEFYEDLECDKNNLNKREGEIIREFMMKPQYVVLNSNIAGRTAFQYVKEKYYNDADHRSKKLAYFKENTNTTNKQHATCRSAMTHNVSPRLAAPKFLPLYASI